jgi:hypothetical protein
MTTRAVGGGQPAGVYSLGVVADEIDCAAVRPGSEATP